ncbi:MAG: nucleotidyl transferase AbiEii/AbiGii toxin family protein [Spirochaetales bacterium]|nr:nucleotidyl transferase AbiEii/AbiGii toxin family protein [Spirochaetales bacterium]
MKFHTECIVPELIRILEALSHNDILGSFQLGGGTSLALQFGHRKSLDIDLFSVKPFQSLVIQNELATTLPELQILNRTAGSLCLAGNKVKLDILHHPYPLIQKSSCTFHFPLVSLEDMAAMKINAVTNRGSKKDFSDILLLHEQGIPVKKALGLFCIKYGEAGRFNAVRSLNWFDDTEDEPDPVYLNGWDWEHVRGKMEALGQTLIR